MYSKGVSDSSQGAECEFSFERRGSLWQVSRAFQLVLSNLPAGDPVASVTFGEP